MPALNAQSTWYATASTATVRPSAPGRRRGPPGPAGLIAQLRWSPSLVLPPVAPGCGRSHCRRTRLLERGVNLLIAPDEITAVVDVRRHRSHGLHARMGAAHGGAERDHVRRVRIGAVEEPEPQAVAIGRGRPIRPAGLAPILHVGPEDHVGVALPVGLRILPDPGETDRVGRCPSWLRTTRPIPRIAEPVHHLAAHVVAGQAGAVRAVERLGVEVAGKAGPDVAHMGPAPGDAGTVRRERRWDANRGAHL